MTHAQAALLVQQQGGMATEHVSRQTTMLVIGEEGWPLDDNGQPSVKLQQAERWHQAGVNIQILQESDWLALLGLAERREEIHRLYTPAMLSTVLKVSVHVIRGWARAGLIRPVRSIHRLPYFDFREVSSARRLSELLESGVPRREIEESLKRLPAVRRGEDRPLEQLEILALQSGIVIRDEHGLIEPRTGQRLIEFDSPEEEDAPEDGGSYSLPSTVKFSPRALQDEAPRDWLVEGCRLYDAGQLADALEAFRMAAMSSPGSADVHFQLGECLYRLGNVKGALERYYSAVEHDHDFLEAWTQIGCLHRELGEAELAQVAFTVALDVLPDYSEAHFHLAETLHELGDDETALVHWREYLKQDSRGPWADLARQRVQQVTR
jgi:tetratricopeptide (TPR) repeat protein